ncbi:hypothetical protein MH215_16375 [Paenibacillus sp. ACRSA]|uniref:hypothetical protein n=1 Tax=Paenibacillus sp. ACRSA TaxID=2918211 RepID=UPI001EF63006|nr:hypothetical protein [Paenibacillus sp. ACRSA]MCG7378584.1 hypothetical protein [Paenibacillus sp. ACRSA]
MTTLNYANPIVLTYELIHFLYLLLLSSESLSAAIEHRKLDINATEEEQLQWLEDAGFQVVDCMYKYLDFVVFYPKK